MGRQLIGYVTVVALLLALVAIPQDVRAAESGTIDGRLLNGTEAGKQLAATDVGLYYARSQDDKPTQRFAKTDSEGRFRFTGLPTGSEYGFLVFVNYGGVEYTSQRIELTAEKPTQNVTVEVYEPTKDDSSLSIQSASVVMLEVNKETQSVLVLETFIFQNRSRQAFAPSLNLDASQQTPPQQQMQQLLRFSIPANAVNLQKIGKLSVHQVIQNEKGFATDLPLLPGTNEVSFMYEIPYRDPSGAYAFEMTLPYPTEQFRLLYPKASPARVSSAALQPGGQVQQFPEFNVLSADGLEARARVDIALSGLPVNEYVIRPDNEMLPVAAAGLLALLCLLGLLLWRRHPARLTEADGTMESSALERDKLVGALAALDQRYEAGELDQQSYRRERDLRKQRLISVMAAAKDGQ